MSNCCMTELLDLGNVYVCIYCLAFLFVPFLLHIYVHLQSLRASVNPMAYGYETRHNAKDIIIYKKKIPILKQVDTISN